MAGHGRLQIQLVLALLIIGAIVLLGNNFEPTGLQTFGTEGIEIQQTNVTACGTTISSAGDYQLIGNISGGASADCITVTADNVTLNCQGFTIDGADNFGIDGIKVLTTNNTDIQNCLFTDWFRGVIVAGSNYSRVTGSNFTSGTLGIDLQDGRHGLYENNNASGNTAGFTVSFGNTGNSTNNTIRNNVFDSNTGQGISLAAGFNNVIENNSIRFNSDNGIYFSSGAVRNYTIRNNEVTSSGSHGINFDGGTGATIDSNNISFNGGSGIRGNTAPNATIIDNDIVQNTGGPGIFLTGDSEEPPGYINVTDNLISSNNGEGVLLNLVKNSTVHSNTIFNNSASGIGFTTDADGNNITNNQITSNDRGVHIGSGANNTVNGNNISSNSNQGVILSSFNIVMSNTINNNALGINIGGGSNIISSNSLSANTVGIISSGGTDTISSNTVEGAGVLVNLNTAEGTTATFGYNLLNGANVSFIGASLNISNASITPADPSGFTSTGEYLNISNTTASVGLAAEPLPEPAFIFLNWSYFGETVDESSVTIAKFDDSSEQWVTNGSQFSVTSGVNTVDDYVFANITLFDNPFAVMSGAAPAEVPAPAGGPGAAPGAIRPDEIDPGESQTYDLGLGDTATFSTDGEVHTVRLTGVTDDTASFEVSSTPVFVTLVVGESADLDLDGNTLSDTRLTLLSTIDNSARIRVTALFEEFVPEAPAPSVPTVQPPTVAAFFAPIIATTAGQIFIAIAVIFAAIVIAFSIYDGAKRKAQRRR